jgi:NADH-quinone oxidoreductase subunit N
MISFDKLAIAFSGIILLTAFFWFILANNYFDKSSSLVDHFALVLFALVGALMLTAFKNMTTLFLGIEIMSIPLYVLAASKKEDLKSNEAGFKYLIMGSFASGFLLFGIALIYGACGTFDIMKMRMFIEHNATQLPLFFYVGVVLILIALLFKISAAPFHFWAPDVYEGSPILITALMSTIVKTAAFAAIFRLFSIGFGSISEVWTSALALIIAASLIIANFSAAMQSNVKRMLAFSSISHAGFMLMVILANIRTNISLDAIIYYSLAYSIGSISAFGILYNVSRKGNEDISAFNGLSKNNPLIALCMTLAMFSLAGIPITAGFFAKYFVFTTLIGTPYKWLLILAIITSAVGAYYYFKIVNDSTIEGFRVSEAWAKKQEVHFYIQFNQKFSTKKWLIHDSIKQTKAIKNGNINDGHFGKLLLTFNNLIHGELLVKVAEHAPKLMELSANVTFEIGAVTVIVA